MSVTAEETQMYYDTSQMAGTQASRMNGPIGTFESSAFPGLLFPPNRETRDRSESPQKTTVSIKLSKDEPSGRDEISLQISIRNLQLRQEPQKTPERGRKLVEQEGRGARGTCARKAWTSLASCLTA